MQFQIMIYRSCIFNYIINLNNITDYTNTQTSAFIFYTTAIIGKFFLKTNAHKAETIAVIVATGQNRIDFKRN